MWGRAVYDNIRKFVQFQVTVNIVALSIAIIGAVSGYGEPLTAVQLLWVNLIMDTFAALALGTEAPNPELLQRRPYSPSTFIISPVMWRNIAVQSTYQVAVLLLLLYGDGLTSFSSGWDETERNTVIFNSFVWMQLFNEINSRKCNAEWNPFQAITDNWMFPAILLGSVAVQIVMVQSLGQFASTTPLSASQWLLCIALGVLSLPVGFLQRLIPVNYRYGEIELEPWTFEGAHLEDDDYDTHRLSSRELLSGALGKDSGKDKEACMNGDGMGDRSPKKAVKAEESNKSEGKARSRKQSAVMPADVV